LQKKLQAKHIFADTPKLFVARGDSFFPPSSVILYHCRVRHREVNRCPVLWSLNMRPL